MCLSHFCCPVFYPLYLYAQILVYLPLICKFKFLCQVFYSSIHFSLVIAARIQSSIYTVGSNFASIVLKWVKCQLLIVCIPVQSNPYIGFFHNLLACFKSNIFSRSFTTWLLAWVSGYFASFRWIHKYYTLYISDLQFALKTASHHRSHLDWI